MTALSFKAQIEIRDGNPYVLIPEVRAMQLRENWHKPMPVLIRINGSPEAPWRINMMPVGDGGFYLYLHGDVRKASQTTVGDLVTVTIEFDASYRNGPQHPMPEWFKASLDKNKLAKDNWTHLPPSRQKEVLRYFFRLKSDEAKRRNLEKVMAVLSGEAGRFMARDWEDGR